MSASGVQRGVWVLVVLALSGCRSLVEPDAEVYRPPIRFLEGTVVQSGGPDVVFTQVALSNAAYVAHSPVARLELMTSNGEFSIPVPGDFIGLFDIEISYLGPRGPRSFLFLSELDAGGPLQLLLELAPVEGTIELPEKLLPYEFTTGNLRLMRSDGRAPGYSSFGRTWNIAVDPSGVVDDYFPAGQWQLWLYVPDQAAISFAKILLDPAFTGGSISQVVDLRSVSLRTRMPEGWPDPIEVKLEIETPDGSRVEQITELQGETTDVWAAGRWVRPRIWWSGNMTAHYSLFAPARSDGSVDLDAVDTLDVLLPPRVLRLHLHDGGEPVVNTRVRINSALQSRSVYTDDEGDVVYFCENGLYEVTASWEGADVRRIIEIAGDTAYDFDLSDSP